MSRLDRLGDRAVYVPIDTATMRLAARLWAGLRQGGGPTADDAALDADVILAAQAILWGAIVVTDNPKHLEGLVPVAHWRDV